MITYLDEVAYDDAGWPHVAVHLARLGQVGDAGVRAHQHVDRVQRPLQESPLRLRQVDPAQRRFRQVVVRHQRCNPSINIAINQSITGIQSINLRQILPLSAIFYRTSFG
jgi:hypothetical protein